MKSFVRAAVFATVLACAPLALAQFSPIAPRGEAQTAREPNRGSPSQVVPNESPLREPALRNRNPLPGIEAGPRQPIQREPGVPSGGAEPIIPCPFPELSPQEQQYLDQLLKAWEDHSGRIERYRCEFQRWEYDPIFGPADPNVAKTYAEGKLRYAAPDKGLFKVETVKAYTPLTKPDEKPQWVEKKDYIDEYWVCDGKRIFEFNSRKKQLIEKTLPPEMHGKAIVDGPLPFLFGAKADKIKARYWLRLVTPSDVKGEWWLEASPKFRADAQNFKAVSVIIDEQDFLPKAIQVLDPAYDAKKRPVKTVFTFNKREVNWNIALSGLKFWEAEFYEPRTPLGWKKVVEQFLPEETPSQPPSAGQTPTAQRPPSPVRSPFKQR
jgi:TIGR03009 family protein